MITPGPCTYLAACGLMRLHFRVTSGQRRRDRDVLRDRRQGCAIGIGMLSLVLWGALVAAGIAVWRWW